MKILNFGSCNIDYVYLLDHIVEVGETESTMELNLFPGGKGLNQSIAITRAGTKVYHAGCIGDGGEFLLDILQSNGVDVSFVEHVNAKNGHAIIQVSKKGENSIFLYPGSNRMISGEQVDRVLESFSKDDILLLQNEINDPNEIIEKAYRKGMKIILNPSPCNEEMQRVDLHMISYLILNELEIKEISHCENVQKALLYFQESFPKLKIMLTLGSRGCVYQAAEEQIFCPTFQVDAVDTTGAGDTFTGYFIAGIANGWEMEETLKLASCAAAISVTVEGAATSIPYLKDVRARMDSLEVNQIDIKSEMLYTKIEAYVDEHLQNASLAELSELLGYSIVYTGDLVKRITGETFKKFLQKKRLTEANALLLQTDLSVDEIVKKVGYENASFFRKIFKEKYGTTPLNCRKKKGEIQ